MGKLTAARAIFSFVAWAFYFTNACAGEDLTNGAKVEASKIVESVIQQLPDGSSMSSTYTKAPLSSDWYADYWQYSEFKWKVEAEDLTSADRLNGLAWKGKITTTMAAYRHLHEGESSFHEHMDPCWESWKDMEPELNLKWALQNIGGQWKSHRMDSGRWIQVPLGDRIASQKDVQRVLNLPKCSK